MVTALDIESFDSGSSPGHGEDFVYLYFRVFIVLIKPKLNLLSIIHKLGQRKFNEKQKNKTC